ncbi:MAG: phenylalanine--tRNA ligase subunit beta, partial [Candidatus Hydrogenedentes bacterium]|nr:phenylalanine--tRNA ligase subunit beta [Candidatus Hydrogenedentota bacterium]
VGLRSVNNVVDVTNFVLMEYSQPLHSFDYDKLKGHRIVVRRAKPGETLLSIDQTECELTEEMCVIADADRPVAIAGIMGALNTEVTESTINVLMESAMFDPLTTRRTARKLAMMSESNYRFERGVDPVRVDEASLRACALICELGGGELAEGVIDVYSRPYEAPRVSLRPERTCKLLGIDVPPERQRDLLDRLGLGPAVGEDGKITCTIPSHRSDLRREADLIEEVARLVGYDEIPVGGKVTHPVIPMGRTERIRRWVLETLVAAGYSETVTFSFIDPEEARLFGVETPLCVDPIVRKTNNALRPTLLPSLLRACKTNQDVGNGELSLFELAAVFPPADNSSPPNEFIELALVTTEGLRDVRGAVEAVVERVAPGTEVTVVPGNDNTASEILLDTEACGEIGMISTNIRKYYDMEKPVATASLRFDALQKRANLTRTAKPLPKFPPIRRDMSLIIDENVAWGQLADAIQTVDQPLRVRQEYVTTYRGKPIPKGRKSVTVALEYRSGEGTLTSEEADQQVRELFSSLQEKFAAELRM